MRGRAIDGLQRNSKERELVQCSMAERPVPEILAFLKMHGFTLEELLEAQTDDLNHLTPSLLTGLELFRLKTYIRKNKSDSPSRTVIECLARCVGRIQIFFQDASCQFGTCVYVGNGFAITAYHVLQAATNLSSSSSKEVDRQDYCIDQILVEFPNTQQGNLTYTAVLACHSSADDLALVRADKILASQFQNIDAINSWPMYRAIQGDTIHMLSFPVGKSEGIISHNPTGNDDYPWQAEGKVTCVDYSTGQSFASYSCFGGGSGGLVIHLLNEQRFVMAFHLGTFHEIEALPAWNKFQLARLNSGLGEKSYNGYFTTNVGIFLDRYFQPSGCHNKVPKKFLHKQVIRYNPKESAEMEKPEEMEEIDLFGPWHGLD